MPPKESSTNRTKQLLQECVELYRGKLETISQNCCSVQELRTGHEDIAAEIEAVFRDKCPLTQKAFVDSNVQKLLSTLKGIFEETTTKFGKEMGDNDGKFRKEEESTQPEPPVSKPRERTTKQVVNTISIGDQFRPLYFEEIDSHLQKNEYIQPNQFVQIHSNAKNNAIAKITGSNELTKPQEAELKKVVEENLEIFQSRNSLLRKQNVNFDSEKSPAIGIDLGTTFCCVGVFLDGKIQIIPNQLGRRTTPSYVRLEKNGEVTVGKNAKDNAYRYPDMTIYDAKRLIGRKFEDSHVQNDMKLWPFDVKKGAAGGPVIFANESEYPPEQISAYLLQHLKKDAEEYLKCPVKKAVITVPAYFNDAQRQATIDAGEMAGLQVLTILNEPTAAAMAYKMERIHEDTTKVLIFDFGGGTFDVALLETSGTKIEVIAVDGDSHLGGEDIDRSLMQHCAKQLLQETGVDLLKDRNGSNQVKKDKARQCLRRIQNYCEESKIDLSTAMSSDIEIENLVEDHDLSVSVERDDLESLNREILEKIFVIIDRLLRSAKVNKNQIDDIVLAGGSTRIPMVQHELERMFKNISLNHTINPHEAVAYGAAIHAAILNGSEEAGGVLNSTIQDVTPMSIGIECFRNSVPGQYSIIVPKDTKIPMERKQTYYTSQDGQTVVKITIYQGENPTLIENVLLGVFDLEGIPPSPPRQQKLEVTMEIQETGVLKVSAKSESTKGTNSLTIEENRGRIPKDLKEKITRKLDTLKL